FATGNQTACVGEGTVCDGFGTIPCTGDGLSSPHGLLGCHNQTTHVGTTNAEWAAISAGNCDVPILPGGNPGPSANHGNASAAPEVGLIVKYNTSDNKWEDELGRNWSNGI